MKVLWIASMFPSDFNWLAGPWNIRGTVALRDICGHDVRVVSPFGMTPPPSMLLKSLIQPGPLRDWSARKNAVPLEDEVQGIPVTYPRWKWGPKKLLWGYEGLLMYKQIESHLDAIARDFRPDVIQTPWLAPEGVCAVMMGQKHGIPVVPQGIGNDANFYLHEFPHAGYAIKQLLKADAILFNCDSTRRNALAAGLDHPNTHIIYHGVEVDLFKPDESRTVFGKRIVTVAQLLPRKNHQLLLHAFTRLPDDLRAEASLFFVGGGPMKQELIDLAASLGIADRVTVAGRLPHEDMVREMQNSDVYCLPTLSEGMPVATIEAMSVGLPVIASRVDGLPETIREPDCGILVPPSDVDALTAALVDGLTRNWDRKVIRDNVLQNYTWKLYAENITKLYQSIQ